MISPDHNQQLSFSVGCDPVAGLPIIGIRADTSYEVQGEVKNSVGKSTMLQLLRYTTPKLPGDLRNFPRFEVIRAVPENMEAGFTLLSLRRRSVTRMIWMTEQQRSFLRDWSLLVALDELGQVVWYYEADHRIAGVHKLQNGNLFFHSADYRSLKWISWAISKEYGMRADVLLDLWREASL